MSSSFALTRSGFVMLAMAAWVWPANAVDTWYLVETKSDPNKKTRSLPQIYEGKNLGGHERYTMQTGSFRADINLYDGNGNVVVQYVSELQFNAPPPSIAIGTTFELTVRGKNTGTRNGMYGGASGRWGGPDGMEDQMRVCRIPVTREDPKSLQAECSTSVRFTAAKLPDEFSFIQVAQGEGVAGEFRYCKNRICPSGNPPAPAAAPAAPAEQPESELQATVTCVPNPLVLRISELPSRDCTVWISGWRRNTADVVQVIAPDAVDSYGNHRNGIQVFGVTPPGMPNIGMAPANMSGSRGPDGSYGRAFPWLLRVFACPGQSSTGVNCGSYRTTPGVFRVALAVKQKGARDANVLIEGTAALRDGARPETAAGGIGPGAGAGAAGNDGPPLQGQIYCSTQPLRIRISGLPSQTCTVWISGWRRNTADTVQVLLPEARDSYGNHVNGVQVFGAVRPGEPALGVAPATMGGFRAPDGSYGTSYPWNLAVFACPGQPAAGVDCFQYRTTPGVFNIPILLRQRGARDANLVLTGTAFSGRDDPFGPSSAVPWTPPAPAPGGAIPPGPANPAVVAPVNPPAVVVGPVGNNAPPPAAPPPTALPPKPAVTVGPVMITAPPVAPPKPPRPANAVPPRPAAVSVKTPKGTQVVPATGGAIKIYLAPGETRADIVGRCAMMMLTILAMTEDMPGRGEVVSGPRKGVLGLAMLVEAICRKRLGLSPAETLERSATGWSPNAEATASDDDMTLTAATTIDLPDGAVRFDVPLPDSTLTVRTPAGSIKSTGLASFSAAYSADTGRLSIESVAGKVEFQPTAGDGVPMPLPTGSRIEMTTSGPASPTASQPGNPGFGEGRAELPAARLANRRFHFGWRTADGAGTTGVATLQENGTILGLASSNEAFWRVDEQGTLLFLSHDARISTRFDTKEIRDGKLFFSGPFQLDPAVRHSLEEIPGGGAGAGCGLGVLWRDNDPYWRGSWVRRGDSDVFDATWTGGGVRADAQMVISMRGKSVRMTRIGFNKVADGETADYEGTVGDDGVSVSGTYRWRNPRLGSGQWGATIVCQTPR